MVYSGVGHAPPRNAASLVATGFIVMVEFAHFNRDEEEFPMTEDRLLIEELAAKGGQPDFLRTIAENVLQLIMEADVDGLIGAGRHERSSERATWRNGYRDRSLDTRVGTLNLKIPKLRAGSYFPGFLEPRKMVEKALVAVIQEAWIGGVSTRRVDELVQAMGMTGISKSTVSKLCKDIDERVHAFLKRPLTGEWPYLWLDATYLKVREGGRIISVAAIIAMAVNTEGRREIVGLHIGPSEAEVFWSDFLKDLVRRGLTGVKLVISDAHEGLKGAIKADELKDTLQKLNKTLEHTSATFNPEGGLTKTAQKALTKLDDSIEQLRQIMNRINEGKGSVGKILNDPAYADELLRALKNLNRTISKYSGMRLQVDLGGGYMGGWAGGRGWLHIGIWPKMDRYYLVGLSSDSRGKLNTTTITSISGSTTTTVETTTVEAGGIVLTLMLGKVFWRKLDLSIGLLYGDATGSASVYLGPDGYEDRLQLRADAYFSATTATGGSKLFNARARAIWYPSQSPYLDTVYVTAGIESVRTVNGQLAWFAGAGITFDDDDIKMLFALR
jgi:hypothetical protein